MDVQRLAAPELLLEYSGNCLVRLVHVREHGVAAAGWRLDRVEKSVPVRPRRVTAVDVEPELAFPEGADRLAVDLDVGDEENLLIVLLAPCPAGSPRRGRATDPAPSCGRPVRRNRRRTEAGHPAKESGRGTPAQDACSRRP